MKSSITTWVLGGLAALLALPLPLDGSTSGRASSPLTTSTSDGVTIYGEPYLGDLDATAPLLLLFHQGGSNGRGEYADLASWLNTAGVRAIAWDLRAGGDRHGSANRTVAGLDPETPQGYCDAYADLAAALDYVIASGLASRVVAWGSSYSAALVFRLAAESEGRVSGVIAFSPASGGPMVDCRAREWVDALEVPVAVFRPSSEMERASSVEQREILSAADAEFHVVEDGVHGASMLVDSRTGHDMSGAREIVISWLRSLELESTAPPSPSQGSDAGGAAAPAWDNLRGPHGDGSATSDRALASLELGWKHSIGPGYSGVAVAGGRAVTAFSDGKHDVVVTWSTADGRELWRTPIGPTYRGHDGSTDGPVGTPSLTDERVYLMGPHGDLVALSLESGEILWRRQLVDEWSAPEPVYGFGSSALEVDGVLVVPGGSETHAIIGLDPADGRRLWSVGDLGVNYATPVRIGGELLVASARDVMALDPRNGRELWSFRHSEQPPFDPTYPQLQPLEDGLLLVFKNEIVRYRRDGNELAELWRSSALKNSAAIPVVYGDHLYGFSGTFLTCVSLEDGQSVWKSRGARGRGLIRVDDRLVVLGVGGVLTVALADPVGYREIATLEVSDHGGYTAPSFADGRIYVRNLSDIISVAIDAGAPTRSADAESEHPQTGAFADWMRRIEESEQPEIAAAAFLDAQSSFPVLEDGWVHFVYAGEAQAVSLIGQMNDNDTGEPMRRVGEAQLFVRSYPSVPGGRWQYRFQVDFADSGVDPRNPQRGSGGFFETSEVTFDGFSDPAFVTESAKTRGRLETLTVATEADDSELAVQLYLPADYDDGRPYPLILMPNGEQWIEGGIVAILDRLFESQGSRAIVALVPMSGWVGGSWGERATTLLGEEVLPAIEAAYPIAEGLDRRTLWTVEDKAAVGLRLATASPQRFGRFAFQSPKLYFRELPHLDDVDDASAFRVSWSRYEIRSAESGTDEREGAQALLERLRGSRFETDGGEFVAGPGYRTWRTEADAILAFLLAGS